MPNKLELQPPEGKADDLYYKTNSDENTEDHQSLNQQHQQQVTSRTTKNQDVPKANIGVFLQNKQMMFGEDSLIPQEGDKPNLIDYNALKRGGNYVIDEDEEVRKREEEEQEKQER